MGQVAQQLFGLDNPGDLRLDNLSAIDESDEENRDDEIKKLVVEGLSDETFEYDSDVSNHNTCSFVSDKDTSFHSVNGNGIETKHQNGLFGVPTTNINNREDIVNLAMLPNKMLENEENNLRRPLNPKQNIVDKSSILKNGIYSNGDRQALIKTALGTNKEFENINRNQKNRENEEIEVTNSTISLLHKEHCPQTETEGLGSGIWLSAENNVEQLKTLCEFRERQIQRSETSIAALQKDKRALNHQIGLMKTEMVQIKSQQDETEKFAQLKEKEVNYLKSKIRETIDEYEQACQNELVAKQDNNKLQADIEKLQQEVKLLSALGTSAQQAEVNDVVRQLREKHAKDMASWHKIIAEMEGQIRTYKRTQQLLHEESQVVSKENVQTQTEYSFEEEIERREKELAAQEFVDEFGGCSDAFIEELSNLSEREIVKRVRKEWKIESEKLRNYYRKEINIYQEKLVALPQELYHMWQQTQAELGLNVPMAIKPLSKNAATITEDKFLNTEKTLFDKSTSCDVSMSEITGSDGKVESSSSKSFKEQEIQVNFAAVMSNTDKTDAVKTVDALKKSSLSSVLDEKEMSSVVVQTDETIETYKILATMIETWAVELSSYKERADFAETRSQEAEDELKKLNKKFKQLQKMAVACRKEWKKQEETLRMKNTDMKAHYIEMLQKLNDKLALIDQP